MLLCVCWCVTRQKAASSFTNTLQLEDINNSSVKQGVLRYTNAMFLHEGDEFGLSQVVWGAGLLFHQLDLIYCELVSTLTSWHGLFQRDALPRHHCCVTCEWSIQLARVGLHQLFINASLSLSDY